MPTYIVGAPVSVMVSGWCSVFHQSTLNLMIGRFTTPTSARIAPDAIAALRIVECAHQRDVAEIKEEQHQHRGQPRVPHPPCAPHRLAPEAAGEQAERGEAGADRPNLDRGQVSQRMAPDQRQRGTKSQCKIAGGGEPGRRDVDIHDAAPRRPAASRRGRRTGPRRGQPRSTQCRRRRATAAPRRIGAGSARGWRNGAESAPDFGHSGVGQQWNWRPRDQPSPCQLAIEGSRIA